MTGAVLGTVTATLVPRGSTASDKLKAGSACCQHDVCTLTKVSPPNEILDDGHGSLKQNIGSLSALKLWGRASALTAA